MTRLAAYIVAAALLALAWAWQRYQIVRSHVDGASFATQLLGTSAVVLIWAIFAPDVALGITFHPSLSVAAHPPGA